MDSLGGSVEDCAFSAEGRGSIPGWGTRSHMLQLRPSAIK